MRSMASGAAFHRAYPHATQQAFLVVAHLPEHATEVVNANSCASFEDRHKVRSVYQRFVLASLSVAKSSFVGRVSELTNSFLQVVVDLRFDDLTRRVGVEISTDRLSLGLPKVTH